VNAIKATYRNGLFVPDQPVDWPEGKRVVIAPADYPGLNGIAEAEQANDPESIARWLAELEAIPPLEMTAEEEVQWQAARQAQKDFEKTAFFEHGEKLRRMFE
jgi:predicted DNA-binding antitoxin AbrB/MazE fold protein